MRRQLGPAGRAVAVASVLFVAALWPAAGFAADADGSEADADASETEAPEEAQDALTISDARVSDYPTVSVTVNAPLSVVEADVPAEAFTLLEGDAERDVEVERLRSEDLAVALVIDISGSMSGPPIAAARQAALEFTAGMPAAVPVSVIAYDSQASLVSDFTTDRDETAQALDDLGTDGDTAMYDAMHLAMDLFDERAPDRRAIVLLTDGEDTASEATLDATLERLGESDEVVHIVELITGEGFGTDDPEADEATLATLQELGAAASQGFVASPDDLGAVNAVYEEIAASLLNQYELTYTSEAHGSALVTVQLEHGDTLVEGARDVELPAAPEPDPEPEPEEEPEPGDEDEDDEAAGGDAELGADEVEVPGSDLMNEPWVVWATIAAVIGGVAFLAYYLVDYLRWRN